MKLILKRTHRAETYTIGKLFIDNQYFCDTLEDKDRGLISSMPLEQINKIKIKGITAIPTGTYKITLDIVSPKFSKYKQYQAINGKLPRLIDVPGYEGILIHIGNTHVDTDGCVLVGKNDVVGKVTNSTYWFNELYKKLQSATDEIEITVM